MVGVLMSVVDAFLISLGGVSVDAEVGVSVVVAIAGVNGSV